MPVDSFKWLPSFLVDQYRALDLQKAETPWTPLAKPIEECRFALLTTAGLYVKTKDPPFDLERERQEPTWGDPTYRAIPRDVKQEELGAAHLHLRQDLLQDMNMPVQRFLERRKQARSAPGHHSTRSWGFKCPGGLWRAGTGRRWRAR
jgi:D-proline reductase (dithiol) PrdB